MQYLFRARPGQGATFAALPPAAEEPPVHSIVAPQADNHAFGQGEHVLRVAEEEMIATLNQMIEAFGYRDSAFNSSQVALAAFEAGLSDQTKPRMTGLLVLAAELRKLN